VTGLAAAARRPLIVALAATTAAWFAVWLAFPLPDWRAGALDVLWTLVAAVGGLAAVAGSASPANRAASRALLLLGLGSLAWALGQATWTYYAIFGGDDLPFPSLADAGYLGALPLFCAGVLAWPRRRQRWRGGDVFDAAALVAVAALAGSELVIAPVLRHGLTTAADWIGFAYLLADLLLLVIVLGGLLLEWWEDHGRLLLVTAGLASLVAADTAFALADGLNAEIFNPGWTLPFAAVGAAALLPCDWPRKRAFRVPESARGVVTTILLLPVLVTSTAEAFGESGVHAATDVAVALLLVGLVWRSSFAVRERDREAARRAVVQKDAERAYAYRTSALEASRTGVCVFDDSGDARFWNTAFERMLGFGGKGVSWRSFLAKLDATAKAGDEFAFWISDDVFLRVRLAALGSGELLVSVDDLTVEERERGARNRFLLEVVRAQEQESRRIAEFLHDDVVQQLTALGLQLELGAQQAGDAALAGAAASAREVTTLLRQLVVELHPAVLESQGLTAAVEASAQALRSRGVEVAVTYFEHRLPAESELTAYRLVQEALANALKHAHARRVDVELSLAGEILRGSVRDDGSGFDPEVVAGAVANGHLGLHLVRERVELAGGRFLLESREGAGTAFSFELPVRERSREVA
jgi:signal transduction histidine kinase